MSESSSTHSAPMDLEGSEGNTITESSEPSSPVYSKNKQRKFWCGTHIIRDEIVDSTFIEFLEKQKEYIYGIEKCPTTDRKHYQFYFESNLKSGIRFSSLHKAHPFTHFEPCKSNKEDNFRYCSKDKMYTTNIIDIYIPELSHEDLYPWQKDVIKIISCKPDNRTIHWFWEPTGNVGKTTFSKFLSHYYKAIPLEGKKNDILYCAAQFPSMIYIYDIERSLEEHLSYGAIEKIKNGFYMCAKYESKPIIRNSPHVICFANFEPQEHKLSKDRWNIRRINS